jgi:hypothetical protein
VNTLPSFDPSKRYLGKLCTKGHDWQQTGMSLRNKSDRKCIECKNAMTRKLYRRDTANRPRGFIPIPPKGTPKYDALWQRVFSKIVTNSNGCMEWIGELDRQGYGRIGIERRTYFAHRVVTLLVRGSLPEGLEPDHLCRNRRCVNPEHLEWVTHRENLLRGPSSNMITYRENRCKRGHDLVGRNVMHRKDGTRQCRTCSNAAHNRRYHERKKAST